MEVGLYPTPGVVNIRSTSFYGLSFVRVTFRYGVDFYFALMQASISLQQNVNLPGNQVAQIQQSSLVGEIYRYQLVGPAAFRPDQSAHAAGLRGRPALPDDSRRRADQRLGRHDQAVQCRCRSAEARGLQHHDPAARHRARQRQHQRRRARNHHRAAIGQYSRRRPGRRRRRRRRHQGLQGQGHRERRPDPDQRSADPGQGCRPVSPSATCRGSASAAATMTTTSRPPSCVMGRTQHTNDIIPKVQAEVERLNSDGSLPPGVKIVPYYDRSSLVGVTTHTVLHNLIFGCLLVFIIQWVFLGDLRSAIIVSVNIPFALFFAIIILVLQGEDANLLSLGAVDFGIIVDSAVIMMENIFRNFQSSPESRQTLLQHLVRRLLGRPILRRRMDTRPRPRNGPSGCA